LTGRDGETGPVEIDIVKRRVQTRLERTRTGPQAWLVVTRRPLADEGTREPRASRDASDQDAWYADRDDLPPTQTPASEVEEPSLVELARVIKAESVLQPVSNGAQAKPAWMRLRCAPGKVGIIT